MKGGKREKKGEGEIKDSMWKSMVGKGGEGGKRETRAIPICCVSGLAERERRRGGRGGKEQYCDPPSLLSIPLSACLKEEREGEGKNLIQVPQAVVSACYNAVEKEKKREERGGGKSSSGFAITSLEGEKRKGKGAALFIQAPSSACGWPTTGAQKKGGGGDSAPYLQIRPNLLFVPERGGKEGRL